MRIKGFFYILVFLLLALGSVLLFLSSQLNTIFFYIGEGLILFILIYLTFFYRKIVKPLNTIGSGMELLREQDFSSRLSPVGQYEADRVVNIFNRMMEQLKNERLRSSIHSTVHRNSPGNRRKFCYPDNTRSVCHAGYDASLQRQSYCLLPLKE